MMNGLSEFTRGITHRLLMNELVEALVEKYEEDE